MLGGLRVFGAGLLALAFLAAPAVLAQPEPPELAQAEVAERTDAEPEADTPSVDPALAEEKLRLEIQNLKAEGSWGHWLSKFVLPVAGPLAIAVVGAWYGHLLNRRLTDIQTAEASRLKAAELEAGRFNAFFERRAEAYARAFTILKPTALFFHTPSDHSESDGVKTTPREQEARQLTRNDCRTMGRQLSEWYFGAGGLLMTTEARDAYFALAEALRLATMAADDQSDLAAPTVAEHPTKISVRLMAGYRQELAESDLPFNTDATSMLRKVNDGELDRWPFGVDGGVAKAPPCRDGDGSPRELALRYKDFILRAPRNMAAEIPLG